jgi:GxxExxY protein
MPRVCLRASSLTQRRKDAETQGLQLLGTITRWVSHSETCFSLSLSFAYLRLGVLALNLPAIMTENEISRIIVDAAIEVHRELGGPGLIEDVYEEALDEELRLQSIRVERQLPVRIVYKGKVLRKPLRLDMKVENLVLVDNKAVTDWNPVFEAQMLTYLRLTGLKLGLVINFGERLLKAGIHRVVNGLPEGIEFNAKTQRRKDADQPGAAPL